MSNINQIHPTIKFTYEISDTELTFLDVTLYKGERFESTNILDLKTHVKATNKQLYVHSTSYHPPSTIKAIAKGERVVQWTRGLSYIHVGCPKYTGYMYNAHHTGSY